MPKGKKEEKTSKVAIDEKFQQFDISTKDPRTAVLMLESPEGIIVTKSCQALHEHIKKSEQNCTEVQGYNVVPKLVNLMSSSEKAIVASSLICLSAMTHNFNVRRSLLKLSCVPSLLNALKPEQEVVILEKASYIISQLAEEYSFKQQLDNEKACPYLIKLLSHGDCDVVRNCIKSLSLLTCHYTGRTSVAEENGLPPILSLLESEYAIVQELSLQTLQQCLQDVTGRKLFKESGGLAKLIDFLNNKEWDDLHVLAIDVLSLCLLEEGGLEALHSSNCLQKLLESINNSQIPQMKYKATLTIARAACDITTQKILHDQQAEKVFIQLLSLSDDLVLNASCEALMKMSSLTSSKQYIGLEGGITALVQLLKHSTPSVRSSAICTLSNIITETPSNSILLSEAGGSEHIISLLSDELAKSRIYSASCIISMSPNGNLRSDLIEQGAISSLVQCISHIDVNVQQTTLEAIALLSIDGPAREQFPIEEVGTLVNLLLSNNTGVSRCAAWAMSVLVYDTKIAESVFKSKGLEILEQLLNQSSHKAIQEYIKLALNRLLSGCPAAQYYINGYLPYTTTLVNTEFWDLSMADTSKGFIPLEELINNAPELNKPILTVSLANQSGATDDVIKDDSSQLEISQGSSKHRQISSSTKSTSSSKKSKSDKTSTSHTPEEIGDESEEKLHEGYLPPDLGLMEHITHVSNHIQPLTTLTEQVEALALYVSQAMGGAVGRSTDIQYELLLADTQAIGNTNMVPLGSIQKGSFQHRSLLYKVLADHLGIPCTLYRGNYSRYWNTVLCDKGEWLVDLMYTPGKLLDEKSEGSHYKSI